MHGKFADCAIFVRLINKKLHASAREASEMAVLFHEKILSRSKRSAENSPRWAHTKRLCEVEADIHGVANLEKRVRRVRRGRRQNNVAGIPVEWRTRAGSRAADGADNSDTWLAACSAASREKI